jgi:hypothetical protein
MNAPGANVGLDGEVNLRSRGGERLGLANACGVFTCAERVERVFREVADIENLPRWAGGFCECVYLSRGRWMALTSLGEIYLALAADERAGTVTLGCGWDPQQMHEVKLQITAIEPANGRAAGARIAVTVAGWRGDRMALVGAALGSEWPGLVGRCGGGISGEPGR